MRKFFFLLTACFIAGPASSAVDYQNSQCACVGSKTPAHRDAREIRQAYPADDHILRFIFKTQTYYILVRRHRVFRVFSGWETGEGDTHVWAVLDKQGQLVEWLVFPGGGTNGHAGPPVFRNPKRRTFGKCVSGSIGTVAAEFGGSLAGIYKTCTNEYLSCGYAGAGDAMKGILFSGVMGVLLIYAGNTWCAWDGRVKQGYQSQQQFFEPTKVRPWLDDTVSSATRTMDEAGPFTEIEAIYDFEFLKGTLGVGVFARVLEYAGASFHAIVIPQVIYQNRSHKFQAGRFRPGVRGSGLLIADSPVAGVAYVNRFFHWEHEVFYFGLMEPSAFQKKAVYFSGYSETIHMAGGKLCALLVYDASTPFADASRAMSDPGFYSSLSGDWEFENKWFLQGEAAYGNQAGSVLAGLDMPLFPFLSWQTRIRYQDEGFAPLLGMYSRDSGKQTSFLLRFPWDFYSEQFIIAPQFGVKHTPEQDYWMPGIKLESSLCDVIWISALLAAEQPQGDWGAYGHYEYSRIKVVWMMTESFVLDYTWSKTFDGFFDWKEIQNQVGVVWRW